MSGFDIGGPEIALPGMRIGLLGGSFNPAHEGHLHISLVAMRRLSLDRVWWLVSPQNPLKPSKGMAAYETRLASARAMAAHPSIVVSDIETRLGTRYTVDTLAALRHRHRGAHFFWLMGTDNFVQFPKWHRWQDIARLMPMIVVARPGTVIPALCGKAANRFAAQRRRPENLAAHAYPKPPAWIFLQERLHPESSTRIRREAPAAPRA